MQSPGIVAKTPLVAGVQEQPVFPGRRRGRRQRHGEALPGAGQFQRVAQVVDVLRCGIGLFRRSLGRRRAGIRSRSVSSLAPNTGLAASKPASSIAASQRITRAAIWADNRADTKSPGCPETSGLLNCTVVTKVASTASMMTAPPGLMRAQSLGKAAVVESLQHPAAIGIKFGFDRPEGTMLDPVFRAAVNRRRRRGAQIEVPAIA